MRSKNKGYTLLELLIVITIIGILVNIALPNYNKYIKKTKMLALVFDINKLVNEIYNSCLEQQIELHYFSKNMTQIEHSKYLQNYTAKSGTINVRLKSSSIGIDKLQIITSEIGGNYRVDCNDPELNVQLNNFFQ